MIYIYLTFITFFIIYKIRQIKALKKEQARKIKWEAEKYLMAVEYMKNGGTYRGPW